MIKECLDYGFSSVMIDASKYEFEKNVEITKSVVELAKEYDASVEGEIGIISGVEDEHSSDDSHFTRPKEAIEFIEKTGVDSLAIAIGTAHGAHKFKPGEDPKLRLDILEEIKEKIGSYPIVLHGSSSVPSCLRENLKNNPKEMDLKKILEYPREEMKKFYSEKIRNIFKTN